MTPESGSPGDLVSHFLPEVCEAHVVRGLPPSSRPHVGTKPTVRFKQKLPGNLRVLQAGSGAERGHPAPGLAKGRRLAAKVRGPRDERHWGWGIPGPLPGSASPACPGPQPRRERGWLNQAPPAVFIFHKRTLPQGGEAKFVSSAALGSPLSGAEGEQGATPG